MTAKQKKECCMCRTPCNNPGSKEDIKELDHWVGRGKTWSMCMLGDRYRQGIGVPQNVKRAVELYTMAAEQDYVTALQNLGVMYCSGHGIEPDIPKGKELLMKSATLGNVQGILILKDIDKLEGNTTPSFTPTRTSCSYCGVAHAPPDVKLNPCSGCHSVYYCSKEHQIMDWKIPGNNGHKAMCKKLQ
jgi:TPR repeat protein